MAGTFINISASSMKTPSARPTSTKKPSAKKLNNNVVVANTSDEEDFDLQHIHKRMKSATMASPSEDVVYEKTPEKFLGDVVYEETPEKFLDEMSADASPLTVKPSEEALETSLIGGFVNEHRPVETIPVKQETVARPRSGDRDFLDLPPEIRTAVYKLAAGDNIRVNATPQWYHKVFDTKESANFQLLRASRVIHDEYTQVLLAGTWLVTPHSYEMLNHYAPNALLIELHYHDGLSDKECHKQLHEQIGNNTDATSMVRITTRTDTHNRMKRHIVSMWIKKFEVAVATKAEHLLIDANNAVCLNGCCRLTLDLQREVKYRYEPDNVRKRDGKMKANVASCLGRQIEFAGVTCETEASRLLNCFRLVSNSPKGVDGAKVKEEKKE